MITAANKILNEDGQAILEFILFLPFMMMMYFTIISISGAINGSINQQKATRGYFYYRAANNSTIPRPRRDGGEPSDGWTTFGMQIMGWADKFENDSNPIAPCYKFNLPFEGSEQDSCDNPYTGTTTQFIRVQTVYGVCGATYTTDSDARGKVRNPGSTSPLSVISDSSCLIVE